MKKPKKLVTFKTDLKKLLTLCQSEKIFEKENTLYNDDLTRKQMKTPNYVPTWNSVKF